jgi:hypothetical protein
MPEIRRKIVTYGKAMERFGRGLEELEVAEKERFKLELKFEELLGEAYSRGLGDGFMKFQTSPRQGSGGGCGGECRCRDGKGCGA